MLTNEPVNQLGPSLIASPPRQAPPATVMADEQPSAVHRPRVPQLDPENHRIRRGVPHASTAFPSPLLSPAASSASRVNGTEKLSLFSTGLRRSEEDMVHAPATNETESEVDTPSGSL